MTVTTAHPDAMRALATALDGAADTLAAYAPAASLAGAHGYRREAAEVAATLIEVDTWSRQWATSLRRRAETLERHDAWRETTTFTTTDRVRRMVADRRRALMSPSTLVASLAGLTERSPHLVAGWLAERSAGERDRIAAVAPELVAAVPGVALETRFAANRRLLERAREGAIHRLGELRASRAATDRSHDGEEVRSRIAATEDEIDVLDRLLAPERRYLLVEWEGDGRIAEWVGPTDADHLAVLVPGMGAEKRAMDGPARIARTMRRHAPNPEEVAVITALVYDAPDWVGSAAGRGPADRGAAALSALVSGLPTGRHVTLIGHSYGSLVVAGSLGHRCGDHVDDVVVLGSPGIGVEHVSDLPVPADRFWVGLTAGDEIQAAVHPGEVLDLARCAWPRPGAVPSPDAGDCDPTDRLLHGPNPAKPEFGARILDTSVPPGTGGLAHTRYWAVADHGGRRVPSAALRNLLAVVTGRRASVRLRPRTRSRAAPG